MPAICPHSPRCHAPVHLPRALTSPVAAPPVHTAKGVQRGLPRAAGRALPHLSTPTCCPAPTLLVGPLCHCSVTRALALPCQVQAPEVCVPDTHPVGARARCQPHSHSAPPFLQELRPGPPSLRPVRPAPPGPGPLQPLPSWPGPVRTARGRTLRAASKGLSVLWVAACPATVEAVTWRRRAGSPRSPTRKPTVCSP